MKSYLILALLFLPFFTIADIDHNKFDSIVWPDLKIENPVIKDVFVNVQNDLEQKQIVIPAFIVKSWMKTDSGQPVFFLSAQPYVCEHSKPPHANQMIKLNNELNIELLSDNAIPVYAFGRIKVEKNKAGLFSSAYTLDLQDIQPYE
ncbi:DUF3299 domain-containing protein [Shewanella sp. WPAGA9]|uniref:DUF3299 domain-containing protein n=1 Tax=Shewanella sp. ENK2 TaxID=2775245 RepID=UPI0017835212|nr:DUF3299 domain-containing protein [Shewanella sp. WPAGA9]